MDKTIFATPRSSENEAQARDAEVKRSRNRKQLPLGMKLPVGSYRRDLLESTAGWPTPKDDIIRLDDLLRGQAREIFGDRAHRLEDNRQRCQRTAIACRKQPTGRAGTFSHPTREGDQPIPLLPPGLRVHAFHAVKWLSGFSKVRYRRPCGRTRWGGGHVCAAEPVRGAAHADAAAVALRVMKPSGSQ